MDAVLRVEFVQQKEESEHRRASGPSLPVAEAGNVHHVSGEKK